jgi:hypothetical protein
MHIWCEQSVECFLPGLHECIPVFRPGPRQKFIDQSQNSFIKKTDMKKTQVIISMMLLVFMGLQGCKKDKVDPNEEELITTVRVKLTESGTNTQSVFEFRDLDGDGGAAPSKFDQIVLTRGKVYSCTLEVLNESVSPADNITNEILAEANDHEFFFQATDALVAVSNLSKDGKGLPLGVTSTWTAAATAGTGTVNVTLKHKPGIKAAGDSFAIGDTDISLDFSLRVQ